MESGNETLFAASTLFILEVMDSSLRWRSLLMLLPMVIAAAYIFLAMSKGSKFPAVKGPKTFPMLGNLFEVILKGYPKCHLKWLKEYGSVFRYAMGRIEFLCICDPDLVRDIIVKNFKSFHDRPLPGFIHPSSLKAMVFAQGAYWTSVRSAVLPLFHSHKLKNYGAIMNSCSNTLVDTLKSKTGTGTSVDILDCIQAMAVDIIGQAAFGIHFHNQGVSPGQNKLASTMAITVKTTGELRASGLVSLLVGRLPGRVTQQVMGRLPFTRDGMANKRMKYLLTEAGGIAKNRSTDPKADQRSDLLSLLSRCDRVEQFGVIILILPWVAWFRARTKDSQRALADDEVAAICNEFMLAGSDTTANTVAFAVYLLSKHRGAEKKMVAEIDGYYERIAGVSKAEVGGGAEFDESESFPYVGQVVQETLRLYPTGATLGRLANEDVHIGDLTIPKGTFVMIPVYAMHHNPDLFPEPESFRPERFDPSCEEAKSRHPYAFIPFGGGPRMCIGYKFALEEARITLISLYRNFRFELDKTKMPPPGEELEIQAGIVLKPKHGIWVNVEPRTNVTS